MPANFLHGVETVEVTKGARPVRAVKTAVIGLVGTAPVHHLDAADRRVNEPFLVLSDRDAGRLAGPALSGYTIPQALDAIFDQGRGTVIVINVFDPATHKTAVPTEAVTLGADGTARLAHGDIIAAVVKSQDGATTHAAGTDYTLDPVTGTLARVADGAIAAGATLRVDYDRADPSKVTASDVIGGVDVAGRRLGMQGFLNSYNLFGMFPKILIAPVYCTQQSVAVELEVLAAPSKCRGIALVDAPIGTTRDQAITGRGPSGAINFGFSSERVVLCYPHLKVHDAATDSVRLEPYSQRLAGVIAATDDEFGYWYSPSNKVIKGIVGAERDLSAMINDPTSDVNLLNEVGIVTLFNSFGTGLRTWGNRSSAWPASTAQGNFIQTRRTADMVHESLEYAMLQFIDLPINDALIEGIVETGNAFIRTLIGRGALTIGSRCEFNKDKNPATELAAGHLTFDLIFCPPPPAERITFESFIDVQLLANLGG
ncbi:MAG TPA: phage tail sheath subtilisin-like domain-containing protein [Azospirillum sp.]|nr:phage tail sheath subtilisin-like domain-containing protein [Azospirillum sp.]